MYKPTPEVYLDTDKELKAVIDFITASWEGFDTMKPKDIKNIFKHCWDKTLKETSSYLERSVRGDLSYELEKIPGMIENPQTRPVYSEASFMMMYVEHVKDDFNKKWDFVKFCNSLESEIKSNYPEFKKIKPNGWAKAVKNYDSDDGFEAKETIFNGVDSGGASVGGIHVRLSLYNLLYDAQEQKGNPLKSLFNALVAHALFVNAHNTTVDIRKNMAEIIEEFKKPEYQEKTDKVYSIEPFLTHPILKQALKIHQDKQKETRLATKTPSVEFKKLKI